MGSVSDMANLDLAGGPLHKRRQSAHILACLTPRLQAGYDECMTHITCGREMRNGMYDLLPVVQVPTGTPNGDCLLFLPDIASTVAVSHAIGSTVPVSSERSVGRATLV